MRHAEEFVGTRARWEAGLCPCCGGDLCDWFEFKPQTVAEEVVFCGLCIGQRHHVDDPGHEPGFLPALLEAIVKGL